MLAFVGSIVKITQLIRLYSLKIISWNVNGIRACLKKGFEDYVREENPDIICIQETKAQEGQAVINLPEYTQYWNSAIRKGYSGTAIFTKKKPKSIIKDIRFDNQVLQIADKYGDANTEGRVLVAEYEDFFMLTVYTPNSKPDLSRLEFRHKLWDSLFLKFIKSLEQIKPVIFCGDLNVAHQEIDLARPDTNHSSHGFTPQEREGFENLVKNGFVDTFRMFNNEGNNYTWWAPFGNARANNVGWRIDYFCASNSIKNRIIESFIRPNVMGSDHCPVGIILKD